ncbi:MAG: hypothetical protein GX816_03945 [Erysipelotrichia bacterium]|jgi:hypothetical protein|nr:hypothetical protein [Bacilli bacterium]MDD4005816.1 hypothetical protein [Bacilli bacterium]NMV82688.1 hypothetical protein [Erysipelotrichia bacterium]
MEFKITNTQVYGLDRAIKASGNPMRVAIDTSEVTDKDFVRASKLGASKSGEGHDNYLKGILVQMDVTAPLFWWKQAQRYHWFDFISSQSTMHCLLKFDIATQCVSETNNEIVRIVDEMVSEYHTLSDDDNRKKSLWREIVASLPSGFCLGATMTTNYQQLKTMYLQRRYHKLIEWRVFAEWCESLPHFQELTGTSR